MDTGTRNAGVKHLPRHHRRVRLRQYYQHVVELRALALVDSHRVDRFVRGQADRGEAPHAAIGRRKVNTEAPARLRIRERNTDIPIKEALVVIVAGDHHRATRIPDPARINQSYPLEEGLQILIERRHTNRTTAVRAYDPKAIESSEHLRGWCLGPDALQIGPQAPTDSFREVCGELAGRWLRYPAQIRDAVVLEQVHCFSGVSVMYRARQGANAAVRPKAIALLKEDHSITNRRWRAGRRR